MLDTIRELLRCEPFAPFWIILTSGNRYEVCDRHRLALGETNIFYVFPKSDRWAQLTLNQIAAVEAIQRAA